MTRKMNNFVCMTLAVCVHIVYTIQGERCEQTYLSDSGLTCSFCAPGTYKVGDCKINSTGAWCTTCPKDTYQKICNRAESCAKCDPRCKVRYKKVKDCTMYENIICKCKDGYFEKNGVCTKSSTAKKSTGNHAYKPTQRTEWYNSSTVHRQNSPTQTTEWYTDSSTVHSSTANMPKHTTECYCSGGFKVIFIVLITLISLTLLILLVCVFIYVSGQGEQAQELWKKYSCCLNCSKRQAGPTPETSQTGENGSDSTPTSGTSPTGENGVNDSTPTSGTSPTGDKRVTDSTPETGPPQTRENSTQATDPSPTGENRTQETGPPQTRENFTQTSGTSQTGENRATGPSPTVENSEQETSPPQTRENSNPETGTSTTGQNRGSRSIQNLSSHQTEDSHDESGNEPSATTPLLNGAEQINLSYSDPRNSGQKIGRSLEPTRTGSEINKGDLPDNSCLPMVSLSSKEKVQGNR